MSYVKTVLLPDEEVIYECEVHWGVFILPAILTVIALIPLIFNLVNESKYLGVETVILRSIGSFFIIWIMVIVFTVQALIHRYATECVITNKRVIAKYGFIYRKTSEILHSTLEGLSVDQSILGRMLGYGTIVIQGTGGGKAKVKTVRQPLEFRQRALRTAETMGCV